MLVAQWTAHQTSNLGVAGSNPVGCGLLFGQPAGRRNPPLAKTENAEGVCLFVTPRRAAAELLRFRREAVAGTCAAAPASIAQLAEHLPRKQKVSSSILDGG